MKRNGISWGWRIIILYAVFMAATIGWVGFAMTQEVDLVRPDYYEHGLDHDKTMAARARTQALGANASIVYDRDENMVRIQIPCGQGIQPEGTLALYRPNAIDSDRTIVFAPGSDGSMAIPARTLAPGVWKFTLDWKSAGLNYELVQTDTL